MFFPSKLWSRIIAEQRSTKAPSRSATAPNDRNALMKYLFPKLWHAEIFSTKRRQRRAIDFDTRHTTPRDRRTFSNQRSRKTPRFLRRVEIRTMTDRAGRASYTNLPHQPPHPSHPLHSLSSLAINSISRPSRLMFPDLYLSPSATVSSFAIAPYWSKN